MSRVAKNPIKIPAGVEVQITPTLVAVKSSKGRLECALSSAVKAEHIDGEIRFSVVDSANEAADSLSGTTRALVSNMVKGVTEGFQKKLTLIGVGYRAAVQGKKLNLSLGFSHPVVFDIPEGIQIETPSQTEIWVKGINKQQVAQVAANVRGYRPPEPYKGKGVRYADEVVVIKETEKK